MQNPQTVFIHIGQPKTGTSAIQTFLKANRQQLGSLGYTYPQHCHHLDQPWKGDVKSVRIAHHVWTDIKSQAAETSTHFILSNEGLGEILFTQPGVARDIISLLGQRPIKIILYLRRQDLHLESYYRQLVRGHKFVTPFAPTAIDRMVYPGYYDYAQHVRSLESQFGRENVILRVYDKNTFVDGNLAKDFCQAMDIPWDDSFIIPPKEDNPSIDARLTKLLLAANASIPEHGGLLREFKELIDCMDTFTFATRENKLLTTKERVAMMQNCSGGNHWIAQRHFGRDELFDTSNLLTMGDPVPLAEQDLYLLMFNLNAAWTKGMGAVPFPLYNKLKVAHLDLRLPATSGAKRNLLSTERSIFRFLTHLTGLLAPRSQMCDSSEKTMMRYIRKNANLVRKKGATLLR